MIDERQGGCRKNGQQHQAEAAPRQSVVEQIRRGANAGDRQIAVERSDLGANRPGQPGGIAGAGADGQEHAALRVLRVRHVNLRVEGAVEAPMTDVLHDADDPAWLRSQDLDGLIERVLSRERNDRPSRGSRSRQTGHQRRRRRVKSRPINSGMPMARK